MDKLLVELCCGKKSVSRVFKERGWSTLTIDINPDFEPDIVADIRTIKWNELNMFTPGMIWCSPPCTEFSREFMPWSKTGKQPDMSIVEACVRIIDEAKPKYWVIENTKGAVPWLRPLLGKPRYVANPYYLWGRFPDIPKMIINTKKQHMSSGNEIGRAVIPDKLTMAVFNSITFNVPLDGFDNWERQYEESTDRNS